MLQDIATLTGATVVGDELGVPLAQADSDYEREWLDTRIARLAGGVAVIRPSPREPAAGSSAEF
jgi:hypothetical protein